MSFAALWLWGYITLASLVMLVAWGRVAQQIAVGMGVRALLHCRPYLVAFGLCVSAVGLAAGSGYRVWDALVRGVVQTGTQAAFLIFTLVLLAISKTAFIWAGALPDADNSSGGWHWWAFLYAVIVWTLALGLVIRR